MIRQRRLVALRTKECPGRASERARAATRRASGRAALTSARPTRNPSWFFLGRHRTTPPTAKSPLRSWLVGNGPCPVFATNTGIGRSTRGLAPLHAGCNRREGPIESRQALRSVANLRSDLRWRRSRPRRRGARRSRRRTRRRPRRSADQPGPRRRHHGSPRRKPEDRGTARGRATHGAGPAATSSEPRVASSDD